VELAGPRICDIGLHQWAKCIVGILAEFMGLDWRSEGGGSGYSYPPPIPIASGICIRMPGRVAKNVGSAGVDALVHRTFHPRPAGLNAREYALLTLTIRDRQANLVSDHWFRLSNGHFVDRVGRIASRHSARFWRCLWREPPPPLARLVAVAPQEALACG